MKINSYLQSHNEMQSLLRSQYETHIIYNFESMRNHDMKNFFLNLI